LTAAVLKKGEGSRLLSGHRWVFSNEIESLSGPAADGDIVEVSDKGESSLGYGFFNKHSLIAVRLFHPDFTGDLAAYFKKRIDTAYSLRKLFYPGRNSFRLVYSDSDYLSGLIIDKYNDSYVLQVYSTGMQKNIELVIEILKDGYNAKNIFSRSDSYFRSLEGLPGENEIYFGTIGEEIIDDGSIKYRIDLANSQKTGFFFDQCDNREFIEKLVNDKSVLDAFCYNGGFGLHSAATGASSVTFVDSSEAAIESVKENIKLNCIKTRCETVSDDVFDYLVECVAKNIKYDVVMVDPPAFAKVKKNLRQGIKGYVRLNHLALDVINAGGFLVSSSCSHHLANEEFIFAINKAAAKAGKQIQLVHFNGASHDHPNLPAMSETSYLKFAVFRVL
jgi:23S rRNA (cytosine1962-C5)-methyltransferase